MTTSHAPFLLQPAQQLPTVPPSDDFWMPDAASVTVEHVDWIWDFLVWMSVVSCVAIFAAMIWLVWKYKATSRAANEISEPSSEHNTMLELSWSIGPLIVCIAVFVWGFKGFINLRTPPKDSIEIHATAQKWKWLFDYPHGSEDVLHVPMDRPVRMVIQSMDVLHALYIPNFRVKMDAVPGRYTDLWFQATKAGEFPLFCAEYCGTAHSDMLTKVIVHPPGEYEKWLAEQDKIAKNVQPTPEVGKQLAEKQGCLVCHTTDGTAKIGPSWKGVFGTDEKLVGGGTAKVDENYLKESILDPTAKVVDGFTPSMPPYQGKLSDRQVDAIIAYIKSLK